jgi:hypothetical protein
MSSPEEAEQKAERPTAQWHLSTAQWHLSLDVECPFCGEDFDITATEPDFLKDFEVAEPVDDYETTCPNCKREFSCDVRY